jgi:4-carboxymuconolactone decarboxylase
MSRLPGVTRAELSIEDQAIWDRITAHRSGAGGPYSVIMHAPVLADRVGAVEDYFRFSSSLPAVDKELVILAVAREMGAHYPWTRHERRAREADMRAELLETLRANGPVDKMTPRERLLVEMARSLVREHALSEDLFARARGEFSPEQIVETIALIGHYTTVGYVVNAFDVKAPEGSRTF